MKRALTALLLTLILALGMTAPALAAGVRDFRDVSASAWYYDELSYAVSRGLVSGTTSATFSPNGTMTRGQFVTVLGRMVGVDAKGSTVTPFADVDRSDYYAPYVAWAFSNGIVSGASADAFHPNSTITREQMAVILANYLDARGMTLPDAPAVAAFRDGGTVSSWAAGAVDALRLAGLLSGDANANCNPKNSLSRVEGTCVLVRLDKLLTEDRGGTGVSLNPTRLSLKIGETAQLYASVLPASAEDKGLTGYSTDPKVATLSGSGLVTAVGEGTARIVLSAKSGVSASCFVTVRGDGFVPVSSVKLSPSSLSLAAGDRCQLTAAVSPSNAGDKSLTYWVVDPAVATVSGTGLVTGRTEGETLLTVFASNGKSSTITLRVTPPVPVVSVTLSPSPVQMVMGERCQLTATVSPSNATDKSLTYRSQNTAVATVSGTGQIAGVSPGKTVITATASNGKSYPVAVYVSRTSDRQAYAALTALKGEYYEGRPWTNEAGYDWYGDKTYPVTHGHGCAAFAFLLSDAAFGKDTAAQKIAPVKFGGLRVGDILRMNNDSHSVIVLEVKKDAVVIAEGNYNGTIHWGRILTRAQVEKADYQWTRYYS